MPSLANNLSHQNMKIKFHKNEFNTLRLIQTSLVFFNQTSYDLGGKNTGLDVPSGLSGLLIV
jgi:hypothetical protein